MPGLVWGVNGVTKALEKREAVLVLAVLEEGRKRAMVEHLPLLCAARSVPLILLPAPASAAGLAEAFGACGRKITACALLSRDDLVQDAHPPQDIARYDATFSLLSPLASIPQSPVIQSLLRSQRPIPPPYAAASAEFRAPKSSTTKTNRNR